MAFLGLLSRRSRFAEWVGVILLLMPVERALSAAENGHASWNIMVLLAANNSLDPNASDDLQKMARVGSTTDVNILVEVSKSRKRDRNWNGDRRFRLAKGDPFGDTNATMLGQVNTGDPATLLDFVRWAQAHYPAKRNALIIWNHGSGWRDAQFPRTTTGQNVTQQTFKAIALDETTGDRLYQAQLESALGTLKQEGVKLDLIGFDACLMSMLEVWYGLSGIAQVGVGSEDLEPGYGWAYDDFLKQLTTSPNTAPADLGSLIVDSYARSITNSSSRAKRKDAFTLAAVRIDAIPEVAGELGKLCAVLSTAGNFDVIAAVRSRKAAFAFNSAKAWPNGIDLAGLANQLAKQSSDSGVKSSAAALSKAVSAAVIANRYSDNRRTWQPNGIAIYFPESATVWDRDPEGAAYTKENEKFAPAFVNDHPWPEFLAKLYHRKPKGGIGALAAPAVQTGVRADLDSLPLDGCAGKTLNAAQMNHRFEVIEKHYAIGLSTEWRQALTAIVKRYCESAETVDSDFQALVRATDPGKSELLYVAIRLICENDDDIPSGLDIRNSLLQYLAESQSAVFDKLADFFSGDVISRSENLPGYAAQALFLDSAYEINLYRGQSKKPGPEISDADAVRLLFAAKAFYFQALDHFADQFQRRLVMGAEGYKPPPGAWRAARMFTDKCTLLADVTAGLDQPESVFAATRSDCYFYRASLGFVTVNASETARYGELWLSRLLDKRAKVESALDIWRMEWYHAWAIGESGAGKSLPLFARAFAVLLNTDLPPVDRERLWEWASVFSNATLNGDIEPAHLSASLFFAQWHSCAVAAGVEVEEQIRIVERSRLFDGSSLLTTAFFGSEPALKSELGMLTRDHSSSDAALKDVRKEIARRISDSSAWLKPTTIVYYTNVAEASLYLYCKNRTGMTSQRVEMPFLRASMMAVDHERLIEWASETFIAPIWSALRGSKGKVLNIVTHTFTAGVPFAALRGGDGRLLVDDFPIVYHTTSIGFTPPQMPRGSPKLTIVHSPSVARPDLFPALNGAQAEADGIVSALHKSRVSVSVLIGDNATRATVASAVAGSNWLHVIAHGFGLASDPMGSALVLSAAGSDNGLLTIGEMAGWPHTLNLMMLASCDSGRTRNEGGFLASASALPFMGVATTLGLSLWPLNDDAGSLLLREFYEQLASGKSPPVALQRAQQETRKTYGNPDFWAPVVLYSAIIY